MAQPNLLQRALKERIYDVVDHTYLNDLIEQSSASRAAAAAATARATRSRLKTQ